MPSKNIVGDKWVMVKLKKTGNMKFWKTCRRGCLAFLLTVINVRAAVDARVEPGTILVGEPARYIVESDAGMPRKIDLPEIPGLRWIKRISIGMNRKPGEVKGHSTWQFIAEEAGTFTIPATQLEINGNPQTTPAVNVTVREWQYGDRVFDDLAYLKVTFAGQQEPPAKLYPGQQLPIRIDAYLWTKTDPRLGYPKVNLENVTFRDYRSANTQHPHFQEPQQTRRDIDGLTFDVVTFITEVTPLKAGTLKGSINVPTILGAFGAAKTGPRAPSPRFNPNLLEDFYARPKRRIRRTLTAEIPAIEVAELPPVPAGAGSHLGLVGEWTVSLEVKPAELQTGETAKVTLSVSGSGDTRALKVPELKLPAFRCFTPEVKHESQNGQNRATVTWAVIPLQSGTVNLGLTVNTFDPEKGEYEVHNFAKRLEVMPATRQREEADEPGKSPGNSGRPRRATADGILYLKTKPGQPVKLPLWRNHALLIGLLTVFGLFVGGGLFITAARREACERDEADRKRQQILKNKNVIFQHLHDCPVSERPQVVREELAPYLNALLRLPPGTTSSRLADELEPKDQDLASLIREAETQIFLPPNTARTEPDKKGSDAGQARAASAVASLQNIHPSELVQKVKRLGQVISVAFLLLCTGHTARAEDELKKTSGRLRLFEQAIAAYDREEYAEADKLFAKLSPEHALDAAILFNRGNCAYFLERYAEALVLYERARRISPRDSDIQENLNFLRSALGLQRLGNPENLRELVVRIRDYLRPDEWMLMAAVVIAILGSGAGWMRWRKREWRPLAVVGALLLVLCVQAIYSQRGSTYRRKWEGVISSQQVQAHRLPRPSSQKADFGLRLGEVVKIEKMRTDWCRIRKLGLQAWVPKEDILIIWE